MESELFNKMIERLHAYYRRKGIPHWDCEDLVQDVLYKLVKSGLSVTAVELAYLYSTARSVLTDKWRKNQRDVAANGAGARKMIDDFYVANDCHNPDYCYRENQLLVTLICSIKCLSEPQRHAFVKHKLKNVSMREIALERKVSVSAIERLLHRAALQLRPIFNCEDNQNRQAA